MKKSMLKSVLGCSMLLVSGFVIAEDISSPYNFKGTVNFDNGCIWKIKNTKVTATAAQINNAGTATAYEVSHVGSVAGVAAANAGGYTNTVTLTVSDSIGNAIDTTTKDALKVWLSTSAAGAVATNVVGAVTATTGTIISTIASGDYWVATDTNGVVALKLVASGAGTNYVNATAGGRIFSTKVAITNAP